MGVPETAEVASVFDAVPEPYFEGLFTHKAGCRTTDFSAQSTQVLEKFGGSPETRIPDPLIESPFKSPPETTTVRDWVNTPLAPC
jgi:hypothetical protein